MSSMTAYGRGEASGLSRHFQIDIKSVNHRYLDIGVHIPGQLAGLENPIRREIKNRLGRGKVDVYVSWQSEESTGGSLRYDEKLAGQYLDALHRIADTYKLSDQVNAYQISRYPYVLTTEEPPIDFEDFWPYVLEALSQALTSFIAAREKEGAYLKEDILNKLEELHGHVEHIEERYPVVLREYEEKLRGKLAVLIEEGQIDEGRLAAEIILTADKLCTDEELVRLESHIGHMRETLDLQGEIGKKLDFLAQEMNRESNTILSKSNDAETAEHAIALKTIVEKIREQIQNIE